MNTTTQQPTKTVNKGKVNKGGKLENVALTPAEVAKNEATPTAKELYRIKMQETKEAFQAVEDEVRKTLGTKEVTLKNGTVKTVEPSKVLVRTKANIIHLESLDNRTVAQTAKLIISLNRVENVNPRKLHKMVVAMFKGEHGESKELREQFKKLVIELKGNETAPEFEEFKNLLPIKFAFSESDAIQVLAKMNKAEQLRLKIEKQNKATAKK